MIKKITQSKYQRPENVSSEVIELLNGLLDVDMKKRLSAKDALEFKWFH